MKQNKTGKPDKPEQANHANMSKGLGSILNICDPFLCNVD